ncbi:MAG: VanZ family protein [Myxococcales bacterium]
MSLEGPEAAPAAGSAPRSRADNVALAWLPAILYTGFIWWLSSQPIKLDGIEHFPFQDKGVHFVEYGTLCLTICFAVFRTWPGRGVRAALAAVLITVGLGLLDELHQAFVPSRSSDGLDLLADLLGAMVFALAYYGVRRWRGRAHAHD